MTSEAAARRRIWGQLAAVFLWAVAFALVEAAVVVYLRRIFHPGGFAFPLQPRPYDPILGVEVAREAATLVMLALVGFLAGGRGWERFARVMVAFGAWDIFYYAWLWVFLGWPPSLATLDVLFLIPTIWVGPVWAPCLVSLGLVLCGGAAALRVGAGGRFAFGRRGWAGRWPWRGASSSSAPSSGGEKKPRGARCPAPSPGRSSSWGWPWGSGPSPAPGGGGAARNKKTGLLPVISRYYP